MRLLALAFMGRIIVIGGLIGLGLAIESLSSRQRVPADSARVNIGAMLLHQLAQIAFTALIAVAVIEAVNACPRPAWTPRFDTHSTAAIVGCTLALAVFWDFAYYWMHRAQHAIPFLWAQHAVHHSDETFNATTAWRVHWTEPVLELVFMIAPSAYLFYGLPTIPVLIGIAFDAINTFVHLNVPMRSRWLLYVINTPQYHRAHHSYLPQFIDRNFAAKLTIWDRLFGTFTEPAACDLMPTGLHSRERIDTVTETALYPLRRWLSRPTATEAADRVERVT